MKKIVLILLMLLATLALNNCTKSKTPGNNNNDIDNTMFEHIIVNYHIFSNGGCSDNEQTGKIELDSTKEPVTIQGLCLKSSALTLKGFFTKYKTPITLTISKVINGKNQEQKMTYTEDQENTDFTAAFSANLATEDNPESAKFSFTFTRVVNGKEISYSLPNFFILSR